MDSTSGYCTNVLLLDGCIVIDTSCFAVILPSEIGCDLKLRRFAFKGASAIV